jgi:hypothetical protein
MHNNWFFGKPEANASQMQHAARLAEEAQALGALTDPAMAQTFAALLQTPWDGALVQFCEFRLEEYRVRAAGNPDCLRPYPGPESLVDQGDLPLGIISETGSEWRLPLADLPHMLFVGPTGRGKTSLVNVLIEGVTGKVAILFITMKDDAARLLDDPPLVARAFAFDDLRLAMFSPPGGVDPVLWRQGVIELLCRAWNLQLSRSLLHQGGDTLAALYREYSRQTGKPVIFTPAALLAWLKRTKTKYTDAPVAVLENLCRVTGTVFEWGQGYPLENLFTSATVLSLASIVDDLVARFLVDLIIDAAHRWLTLHGPNDGSVQLLIILDDGHRFVSNTLERDALTSLSNKYLMVRQSGIRLVTISQFPSDLSRATLSQSGVIVQIGSLVHQHDLQAMGAAFGMAHHEHDRLQQPGKGEFIARENLGRCNRPFAGMVNRFPAPTHPYSDAARRSLMAPILAQWPSETAVTLQDAESLVQGQTAKTTPARIPGPALGREALALAMDVSAHPWDFLQIRYARLNLAGRIAQKAKDELVNHGYVREHTIPRKGRPPILLEPLSPLFTLLQQQPLPWGKGGFVHAFMIQMVMRQLSATGRRKIQAEKYYGSKAVDIVAETAVGELLGFECAHHLTNVADNLLKDFMVQPRFTAITTVCLGQGDVRQALLAIDNAPGLKVHRKQIFVEQLTRYL